MRAKVTNTSQTTVCRGAMVFRGGSISEVVISNEYSLSEIRACRQLEVEVLEDKMTTAAPVEAPVVEPVPFMEPPVEAPVVEPVPFMEPPVEAPVVEPVPFMEPPRNICACGFVAKTVAGLKAHQRTKGC